MSFTDFREVSSPTSGTVTKYGSQDLLDLMQILNGKTVSARRPKISNPWLFQASFDMTETSAPATNPAAGDQRLYIDSTDHKLKLKNSTGTITSIAGGDVSTTQANTYQDFDQTFRNSRLKLANPANTFSYIFAGGAITADRTVTIPTLGANSTFMIGESAQNVTGQKNFYNQKLAVNNPANTFQYIFNSSAIAANRNVTLPLLTADDSMVTQAFVQPLTNKTIDFAANTIQNTGVVQTWRITLNGSVMEARKNTPNEAVVYSSSTDIQSILNSIINAISPAGTPTVIELGAGTFPQTTAYAGLTGSKIGNITIRGQGTGRTRIELQAGCAYSIDAAGTVGTSKNLTANANAAENTITVSTTDAAGFAFGDYIFIRSSRTWDQTGFGVGKQGEIKKIMAVDTGTGIITLNDSLYDSYATADTATVAKITMLRNITMQDLTIMPISSGYTGQTQVLVRFEYVDNLQFRKLEVGDSTIGGGGTNIQVNSCINSDLDIITTMTGNYPWIGLPTAGPYGIFLGQACQHVKLKTTCRGPNWRHCTDGGCINSAFSGIPRDITVSGTAEGMHFSAFNFHEDGEGVTFQNCNISSSSWKTNDQTGYGIFARCKNVVVTGCNIRGATAGIEITGLGNNCVITGNQIANIKKDSGGNHGNAIEIDTGMVGAVISGNVFNDIEAQAIYQGNTTGSTDFVISGNVFRNCDAIQMNNSNNIIIANNRFINGAKKAINMTGTSTNWTFTGNDATGSATSTFVGTNTFSSNTGFAATNSGLSTQNGDGSTKTFNIAHGLFATPGSLDIISNTDDARGPFTTTVGSTNITVTYAFAPASGTNNLKWYWRAGV